MTRFSLIHVMERDCVWPMDIFGGVQVKQSSKEKLFRVDEKLYTMTTFFLKFNLVPHSHQQNKFS